MRVHDAVVLVEDVPEAGLEAGAVGDNIAVFTIPLDAFEVEFVDECGRPRATLTLRADQLRSAAPR